jgi:hypothetical protein
MAEAKNAALIIRYADGNVNKFIFTRPEDEMNAIQRIDEALKSNWIVVELEDRAFLIPVSQIRNIEIRPKPPNLPKYAIRNARLIS